MTNVSIDDKNNLNYETNGLIKKTLNFFLIPILNLLPGGFNKHIGYTNKPAGEVAKNRTSYKALELLYSKGEKGWSQNRYWWENIFHSIWFNTNNSKSIRNRLRLVTHLLDKEFKELKNNDKLQINTLSIASGSARAVVEVISKSDFTGTVNSIFLDKSKHALEYSKNLADQYNINNLHRINIDWVEDTASNFSEYLEDRKMNIVEIVGLLDYFDDEKVVKLFSMIYENLENSGVLLSSNISMNKEKRFVDNAIGWKMIYRDGQHFANLAIRAGFKSENVSVIYEPLKIHAVLIARK